MRVVVTAQGPALSSPTDPRFGRARYLVVLDAGTGECSAIDNEINLNAAQGAGIQTARKVIDLKAEAVITGRVGPKAFAALRAGHVDIYTASAATVQEVFDQFNAGGLQRVSAPDVAGHWT